MVEELRVVPSAMSLELSRRPPGWQNVPIHRTCCNCETYGWTFDKQDVQQCQRCKGVTYCSKVLTMDLHDHFSQQHPYHWHQNSIKTAPCISINAMVKHGRLRQPEPSLLPGQVSINAMEWTPLSGVDWYSLIIIIPIVTHDYDAVH